MRFASTVALAASLTLLAAAAGAQSTAVHRTTLQDLPFPAPEFHTVTVRVVVDPGGTVASHTHPGAEMGYVLSGTALVDVKNQASRDLQAGDSFAVPINVVHSVHNTGNGPLTLLSTYVVKVDQPIATPTK